MPRTDGLLLVHTPPWEPSVSVAVIPLHSIVSPPIGPGSGTTVNGSTAWQPVDSV